MENGCVKGFGSPFVENSRIKNGLIRNNHQIGFVINGSVKNEVFIDNIKVDHYGPNVEDMRSVNLDNGVLKIGIMVIEGGNDRN